MPKKNISLCLLFVLCLFGCVGIYGERKTDANRLQDFTLSSNQFELWAAINYFPANGFLHVYIEGDGKPWLTRSLIAKNPGPFNPIVLNLMREDSTSSLYLGRPCYYAWKLPEQKSCNPSLWTGARYSPLVVNEMAIALKGYSEAHSVKKIILIGHSGGGTLAYLLAQQVDAVSGVIIISGNLDTAAWTQHHGYTPLNESLNPASLTVKRNIPLVYLTGDKDLQVPLALNKSLLEKIGAAIIIRAGYDHHCCWRSEWKNLLPQIERQYF